MIKRRKRIMVLGGDMLRTIFFMLSLGLILYAMVHAGVGP